MAENTTESKKARGKASGKKGGEKSAEVLPRVTLSSKMKDRRLKLSEDRLTATGDRGYVTVLATHGTPTGKWYYEATLEGEGHCRLGWSSRRTRFDFPLGSDVFSFAVCDSGEKAIQGYRKPYMEAIRPGDVVGCYLEIAPNKFPITNAATEHPIWAGLVCDPEHPPEPEISESSFAAFALNGVRQPAAFQSLVAGEYFPAISIFGRAKVRVNFGPDFRFPPAQEDFRPIADLFDPIALLKPPVRPPHFIPRGAGAEA